MMPWTKRIPAPPRSAPSEAEPTRPVAPSRLVTLGETVIVNLGDGVARPLIVTALAGYPDVAFVNGWLFCDAHVDATCSWLKTQGAGVPTRHSGPLYLEDLPKGDLPGQWRFR